MTNELVRINPIEFGLTDETAANIKAQFEPMLQKMVALEDEFNQVVALPIEDANTSKKAKELRLKYVKVRTGTAEIHKQQKAFYLNGGRFVDGWKNAQLFASQGKEEKLEEIEKYFENKEKERKEQLHLTRVELIREYVEDTTAYQFGDMAQDVFDALLSAKKQAYFDKIEAERKAEEEERIAKEKEEAEERERVRIENERLKKEAEEREAQIKAEREKAEEERKAMEEAARKEREEAERKLNEERAKAEAERKKVEAEQAAKLEAERKEREKVEAELKAKRDAEEKAERERLSEIERQNKEAEKLAKAPVKKQLKTWVNSFELPQSPIHDLSEQIKAKFESFKKWATSEIDNL